MKRSDEATSLKVIVSLCKRRGFVFPSSEIYGGFSAIYDFGPYGVELEQNIKREWWKNMVQLRDDVVGLDSSIFMNPRIWEASGHVAGFSDPLVECKICNHRARVDHLLNTINVTADEKMTEDEINGIFQENLPNIKCPNCGGRSFSEVKKFNLLVQSNLGNFSSDMDKSPVYLRGETCQGIYVNYKNVVGSSRLKIPFGIAQIGKAFRNEITARQFLFRTREFEQMEMQYFTNPSTDMEEYERLRKLRWDFYVSLGLNPDNLQWHKHEKLVFYAKQAYDIEYRYPFGFSELEGVHARGNYDLSRHADYSGIDLSYVDPQTHERFIPHVIECSVSVGRIVLALLCDAYTEEPTDEGVRILLKLTPKMAPVKMAVFALVRNRPDLVETARNVHDRLRQRYMCEYDDSGNIGKRYRRQDEIGTPFCVTVDHETMNDQAVTVRYRDSMLQKRVNLDQLSAFFNDELDM